MVYDDTVRVSVADLTAAIREVADNLIEAINHLTDAIRGYEDERD
jgi:molybdate-binding protein